ncbi:hypothetical protein [Burkholderia multivorans]|uniref:hypothetical protein n=1 Tax=Burkholderia multivorans TaxID=87883 RepID=UPI001C280630|nr:hypothetical protein [Burkholderia multivorans]MBU9337265.1 hypothetical protein [Burkholderia multivorans]MCA8480146.1 hypothetical protein [Burkholderia multivorans]
MLGIFFVAIAASQKQQQREEVYAFLAELDDLFALVTDLANHGSQMQYREASIHRYCALLEYWGDRMVSWDREGAACYDAWDALGTYAATLSNLAFPGRQQAPVWADLTRQRERFFSCRNACLADVLR